MKRIFAVLAIFMASSGLAYANPIVDQVQVALFGHVESVIETTTRGETYAELLATPIQIGHIEGGYAAGIDGGVLGNVAPEPGQGGFNWTVGVHVHLSPLIKKFVLKNISSDYPAIAGIEINPRISLDFHDGHKVGVFGIAAGYAWGGTPQQ